MIDHKFENYKLFYHTFQIHQNTTESSVYVFFYISFL